MNEHKEVILGVVAIASITIILITAIRAGIDGILTAAAIGAVAGLGGFEVGKYVKGRKK